MTKVACYFPPRIAAASLAFAIVVASMQAGAEVGDVDGGREPSNAPPTAAAPEAVPPAVAPAVPPPALPPPSIAPPPPPPAVIPTPSPAAPGREDFFHFETLIQVRDQQTWVYIKPALEALVRSESGAAADATLQLIKDTARAHDGLQLRWASLRFEARPKPYLSAGMEVDFSRLLDGATVEDLARMLWEAPVVLAPRPWIEIAAGVLHVPFSIMEMVETSQLEVAERGPTHELLEEQLSLARRNTGVRVDVSPLPDGKRLQLTAGAFQGATIGATGAQDFRGPGLLAGRVLGLPFDHLRLGASAAWRPRETLQWWDELRYRYVLFTRGLAVAANATAVFPRFELRGEWMMGTRTDIDVPTPLQYRRGDARNFMAGWAMAAYRIPVRTMSLMPAVRAEWLDTDTRVGFHDRPTTSEATGRILHFSGALNLDIDVHTRLLLDVTVHDVQPGTRNADYHEIVRYDTNWTSVILQLQVRA